MLGYRLENGQYVIMPDEAAVVQKIFRYYLDGLGYLAIANKLNEENVQTRLGYEWTHSSIMKILKNYAYTGNLLLQKTFRENHITKKTLVNQGELPMYHATDTHKAIIDMATFQCVQEEMKKRASKFQHSDKKSKPYPFTGKLICEDCGKHYRRKVTAHRVVWICSTFNTKGKKYCPTSKQIPEETLISTTADVLGITEFDEAEFHRKIEYITMGANNTLHFHFFDENVVDAVWNDRSRSESWTDEKREAARQKTLQRRNAKWQEQ